MLETKANTEINPQFPFPVEQEEPREETTSAEVPVESTQKPASVTELQAQGHRDVKEIAAAILSRKGTIVQSFLEIGNLLIEAKGQLTKHGGWMNWLDNEVNISYRMAERYMQLARAYANSTSVTDLGMTKALALLALPETQRESFISEPHEVNGQQKTVNDMSVREIRHIIHEKMEPAKTDNIAAKGTDESSSMLNVVHNPNIDPNNRKSPETQPKHSDLRVLTDDIESAQTHLDNIMKVLKEQASDDVGQGRIADDLRSLHNKILQCLNLAKLEVPAN